MCKKLEGVEQRNEQSVHSPRSHSETENSQATACQRLEGTSTTRRVKSHDTRRQNCVKKNEVIDLSESTNNGSLKCFYTNASSLFHKLDELKPNNMMSLPLRKHGQKRI